MRGLHLQFYFPPCGIKILVIQQKNFKIRDQFRDRLERSRNLSLYSSGNVGTDLSSPGTSNRLWDQLERSWDWSLPQLRKQGTQVPIRAIQGPVTVGVGPNWAIKGPVSLWTCTNFCWLNYRKTWKKRGLSIKPFLLVRSTPNLQGTIIKAWTTNLRCREPQNS